LAHVVSPLWIFQILYKQKDNGISFADNTQLTMLMLI